MAWGPDLLCVEAKSPERAQQVASQLAPLGFRAIKNTEDEEAGLLSLSKNPAAVQAKIASFDVSRRRWDEQIEPAIWAACAIGLVSASVSGSSRYPSWVTLPLGVALAIVFFFDAARIWGWRLQTVPDGLQVRRWYRWTTIRWNQIRAIDSAPANWGRDQEIVVLKLEPGRSERLGTFGVAFARNLRDRLRYEIAQRGKTGPDSR